MSKILEPIRSLFKTNEPIPAGIYHYISPQDDPRNYRLHLRVEGNGNGVLIINASTILHLNQTATEYAYYLIKNYSPEKVAPLMSKRYEIGADQAQVDYQDLIDRIQILISTPDLDPISFLDFDRVPPFGGYIPAPYRLDCALTYAVPDSVDPEVAPTKRVEKELSTEEWIQLIDKSWQAGIPHLVFTGGEPTLREDLVMLLQKAEDNGQVTGLISNGIKAANKNYLDELLQTGLDHFMMVLNPSNDLAWESLEKLIAADIYIAVHLTITDENLDGITALVERLSRMGVHAISLSTSDQALAGEITLIRDYIAELNLDLVWNLPVPYSAANPVAFETHQSEYKEGAGRAWLYIEPDGDVLPSQGENRILGNILQDKWDMIWMQAHAD